MIRKRNKRNLGKPLMTDTEVLEARALREFLGFSHAEIRIRYNLSLDYSRRLLDYSTRSKLIPKLHHLPKEMQINRTKEEK